MPALASWQRQKFSSSIQGDQRGEQTRGLQAQQGGFTETEFMCHTTHAFKLYNSEFPSWCSGNESDQDP